MDKELERAVRVAYEFSERELSYSNKKVLSVEGLSENDGQNPSECRYRIRMAFSYSDEQIEEIIAAGQGDEAKNAELRYCLNGDFFLTLVVAEDRVMSAEWDIES